MKALDLLNKLPSQASYKIQRGLIPNESRSIPYLEHSKGSFGRIPCVP